MNDIFVRVDALDFWIAKYFDKDIVTLQEIFDKMEELQYEIDRLNDELEEKEK